MQLLPQDVTETSNIGNVRIYVEQAIAWLEVFLLLKNELLIIITLVPLADDIIRVCCAIFLLAYVCYHTIVKCLNFHSTQQCV